MKKSVFGTLSASTFTKLLLYYYHFLKDKILFVTENVVSLSNSLF